MLRKAEGVHSGEGGWWEGGGGGGRRLVEFRQVRSAHVWRDTATTKQVQTTGHISAKVLAVFPTTTPSTTYLVSTIIAFTSTTTDFVSGSYSTSPSHLCLVSAVLISVLLHFLDPSPPSPVAPFPFDGSPITTCSLRF